MKEIILASGHITIVSDIDYDLNDFNWCLIGDYAHRRVEGIVIRLHTIIAERKGLILSRNLEVDHIDQNKLNNQRENLRLLTPSLNAQNTQLKSTNSSGVKGVNFDYNKKKWVARIRAKGVRIFLGYFETLERATQARLEAENKYLG